MPLFISTIPYLIDLDAAQDMDRKRMAQKLVKIIIQKMPLDKNGELIFGETVTDPLTRIKNEFEPQGYAVFPISAVSGTGLKELLYHVQKILDDLTVKIDKSSEQKQKELMTT